MDKDHPCLSILYDFFSSCSLHQVHGVKNLAVVIVVIISSDYEANCKHIHNEDWLAYLTGYRPNIDLVANGLQETN